MQFSAFINLSKNVEETGVGVQLSNDKGIAGMLFADDFIGDSDPVESLQKLIFVVCS